LLSVTSHLSHLHPHLSAGDLCKVNYPVGELLRFVQCALKYRAAAIELRRKLAEEVQC
jgi:hypothetical protein